MLLGAGSLSRRGLLTGLSPCRRPQLVLLVLGIMLVAVVALFMTCDPKGSLAFAPEWRGRRVAGMALVGFAIGYSSVLLSLPTNLSLARTLPPAKYRTRGHVHLRNPLARWKAIRKAKLKGLSLRAI